MSPAKIYAVCMACVAAMTAALWASGPVSVCAPEVLPILAASVVTLLAGVVAPVIAKHRSVRPTVRVWLERGAAGVVATGAITLILALATLGTCLATPYTGAAMDDWLAAPEVMLGYTQADARTDASTLGLIPLLVVVYGSVAVQLRLACLWHSFVSQDVTPLWEAAAIFGLCIVVGLPIYLILPAAGPAFHYGWLGEQPSFFGPWMAMRSGHPYALTHLDGFVAAPSFHVIFALLLIRLFWRTPFRLAALVINSAMFAAAWVVGCHYATDLVVGATLVGLASAVVRLCDRDPADHERARQVPGLRLHQIAQGGGPVGGMPNG